MSLQTWLVRLLQEGGKPAPGIALQLEALDLRSGTFVTISKGESDAEGLVKAELDPARAPPSLALRLRLQASADPAVLVAAPRFKGTATALLADFGSLQLLGERQRVPLPAATGEFARDGLLVAALPGEKGSVSGAPEPGDSNERALATIRSLEAQLQLRQAENATLQRELAASAAQVQDQQAQVAAQAAELARAKEDLGLFRQQADQKVEVGDYAVALGGELERAQLQLKQGNFRLGAVAVTTRAFIDGGGTALQFPNRADRADVAAAAVSDISIAFQPADAGAADDGKVTVPDVRQLTESAVRRVLASVGLQLDATHGPLGLVAAAVEGQAMLQTPAAGAKAARGESILVVFARSSAAD